ncbi:bifunctional 2-polyprenyl-6-hydroxyphenol methylase/3-demethylubiquinol 3-O-methyltransferase UbiG [Nocardiopsis sp. JB363]|uniref:class I SAM-dependent methyltransferase n=1 Tax=Nocardiopsis sp. JB363 TaxID=1434837 RepID=UPI00097B67C4|nr:class I SAM-dependent methyltransferase [Nocardiopsis sp. JB363]SIO91011.1 Methyltransferase type 12 [Nocardiopsis sp. JB363]
MTDYARMYRLGFTPWERYGPAAGAQLRSWLERESAERESPGRALDIGCGRGQFTPELVNHGWQTTGVDLVPAAIEAAREKDPDGATYVVGDATDLESADLGGEFELFLDVGCFQGLDANQRAAQGRGVTALAAPDATLLMLAFGPSIYRRMVEGVSRAEVEAGFPEWELADVENASTDGLGWPMNRTNPKWYRFRRPTR